MSFRIKKGEQLSCGLRRVVTSAIDRSLEAIETGPPDKGVHDVRRTLKRVRAVLKLVREPLGRDAYKREDVFYRDLGRHFNEVRDAAVLVAIVEKLEQESDERLRGPLGELHDRLKARHRALREVFAEGEEISLVAEKLREGRSRVHGWSLEEEGFDLIRGGLRRSYGNARTGFQRANRSPEMASLFHEWRKRTKDVRHQIELLNGLWPAVLGAMAHELHRLSDVLGGANDCNVLLHALTNDLVLGSGEVGREAIRRSASEMARRLWCESLPLGRLIYAEPPAAFVRRLGSYWEARGGRS